MSGPELDRLLSDPTRLAVMSVLSAAEWCEFAYLRDEVALSDSALSKQLTTLRKDGYIEQQRTYSGRIPKTTVRATDHGLRCLRAHAQALRAIVDRAGTPLHEGS
ncbi:transcriptional regulator [Nocardia alni]|uniref:transcriptional regulator n=1 Tax=Nocardia alni TaxID=2815723 RepID=UPI001C24A9E7|nr:transcriptional regulator [Nocardia alni]